MVTAVPATVPLALTEEQGFSQDLKLLAGDGAGGWLDADVEGLVFEGALWDRARSQELARFAVPLDRPNASLGGAVLLLAAISLASSEPIDGGDATTTGVEPAVTNGGTAASTSTPLLGGTGVLLQSDAAIAAAQGNDLFFDLRVVEGSGGRVLIRGPVTLAVS